MDILPGSSGLANRARRCFTSLVLVEQQLPSIPIVIYSYHLYQVKQPKVRLICSRFWCRYHRHQVLYFDQSIKIKPN